MNRLSWRWTAPKSLTIERKVGDLANPTSISGSKHTDALYAFYAKAQAYDEERDALRTAITADATTRRIDRQVQHHEQPRSTTQCKAFAEANMSVHRLP